MDLIKPKYKPLNRKLKRDSYKEYKKNLNKHDSKFQEIESNFLKALFIDNGATYKEIFKYYNTAFLRYCAELNEKLKYNYIDNLAFAVKYIPEENE